MPPKQTRQATEAEAAATLEVGRIPLAQFAKSNNAICIWSELLEDQVWFVSDNYTFPAEPLDHLEGRVVYRAKELSILVERCTPKEDLWVLHRVKKYAGGSIQMEKAAAAITVTEPAESEAPIDVPTARKLLKPFDEMWNLAKAGGLPAGPLTLRQGVTVTDPNRKVLSCYSEIAEITKNKPSGGRWRGRLTDQVRDLQAMAALCKGA